MADDPPSSSAPAPPRVDEPDSRNSLRHILASEPAMDDAKPASSQRNTPAVEDTDATADAQEAPKQATDNEAARPQYTATTTTTRRNANGSVSSVYSGNKIKHLKKDDGIPLWRKDIQYDFLKLVFENDQGVFTKQSEPESLNVWTFADIYLDAMAKSSKCSKILKDKLLTERPAAINMAMVCLLVNVGRMNTTLNFFPEMRAQLRTYHSIPSLQAHQDPNAYKQLQDAPRLKSILKGATEDTEQPSSIEEIMSASIPRTNPVNLIFVLSQFAPKISELHFLPPRDFFDLVMRPNLSSKSRATAFLWLMWWYLESDFSKEAALRNPFGEGQYGPADDPNTSDFPIKCPPFEFLSPEQEALENVDSVDEKNFGEIKRKERAAILASDMAPVVTGPKRTNKKAFNQNPVFSVIADDGASTPGRDRQSPSHAGSTRGRKLAKSMMSERDYPSDTDRTRSVSPVDSSYAIGKKGTPNMRINTLLNEDGPASSPAPKGPGRGNWRRGVPKGFKNKLESGARDGQSPSTAAASFNGPHGFYLPLNGSDPSHKRTRPLTQHQLAVEQYRRRRVDVILDRGVRHEYKALAKKRRQQNALVRSWTQCKMQPDGYDTDEDTFALLNIDDGIGVRTPPPLPLGTGPYDQRGNMDDYGEEAYYRAKMISRALRRLERWDGGKVPLRRRPKGEVRNGIREREVRPIAEEDEDDEDEEMLDADEERGEESSDDEDEGDLTRVSAW